MESAAKKVKIVLKLRLELCYAAIGRWLVDLSDSERKGERARSRFTIAYNKQNINGKQMCSIYYMQS